jgi:hypothetical protein
VKRVRFESADASPSLELVLAGARSDAVVLRRTGHEHDADLLEALCDGVEVASEEFLRWLSESDAILRSGRTKEWLRSQFPEWESSGHARKEGSDRVYRMIIIPYRWHLSDARKAGQRAGKEAA